MFPDYVDVFQEDKSNYVTIRVTEDSLTINAFDEAGKQIDELKIVE